MWASQPGGGKHRKRLQSGHWSSNQSYPGPQPRLPAHCGTSLLALPPLLPAFIAGRGPWGPRFPPRRAAPADPSGSWSTPSHKTASLKLGILQCNSHEAFYCERWSGPSPSSNPLPLILSSLSFSWLSCLSRSQRGGGDQGVSVGSRLPPASGSQRERALTNSKPAKQQPWSSAAAVAAPRAAEATRGSWVVRLPCPVRAVWLSLPRV